MSDQLSAVELENVNLKKQLEQNSQGVQALLAQIDAYKGELADSRTICLQLRTNLIMFQKSHKELSDKLNELNKPQPENGVCL